MKTIKICSLLYLFIVMSTICQAQWTAGTNGIYYNSGNVGIGILVPTVRLYVAGVVRAHEVKVCLNQGCDYVFDDDYGLGLCKPSDCGCQR